MPAHTKANGYRGKGAGRTYAAPRPYTNTQSTANTEPDLLPDADSHEGLSSDPIQTFSVATESLAPGPVDVKNFKYIGSYNWIDGPHPTIMVPGSPPTWRDRALSFHVPFDQGLQIFDPNGYYMGSSSLSPLIPLFRAVDVVAEDNADTSMDWAAIDIVADRSSLRKLLRWVAHCDSTLTPRTTTGSGLAGKLQDFRIDLQLGGAKTVLMQRWDTRTCQYISPPHYGCRINFERAATAPAPGSTSDHFRIVQYDLKGLQMVVRYQVDAIISTSAANTTPSEADDLSDAFTGLSLSSRTPAIQPAPSLNSDDPESMVTVVHGGSQVPQSTTIEITTRSAKSANQHNWVETFTQLFLSQTPHHFLAVHQCGMFECIVKRTLASPELQRAADKEQTQRHLKQLACLLQDIQGLVQEHGRRGRLSLVCQGGKLNLFERSDGNDVGCIPDSVLTRFGI